jgi:cysteinyl-tRNA synthetase
MSVRFFMLQSQYRSTLDFSNEALKAAQKGYKKLANGLKIIKNLEYPNDIADMEASKHDEEISLAIQGCYDGLNDDLNTAVTIANLFNLLKKINQLQTGQVGFDQISKAGFKQLKSSFTEILEDILGITEETPANWEEMSKGLLALYKQFKENKQYDKVDEIRSTFKSMGLLIKDLKTGIDWGYEE